MTEQVTVQQLYRRMVELGSSITLYSGSVLIVTIKKGESALDCQVNRLQDLSTLEIRHIITSGALKNVEHVEPSAGSHRRFSVGK